MIIIDILGEEGDVMTVEENTANMNEVFFEDLEMQLVCATSERNELDSSYNVVYGITDA